MIQANWCWRICRDIHADLKGTGGLYAAGRWHRKGSPIIYAAEHPALAAFEALATRFFELPDDVTEPRVLMQIDLSAVIDSIETAPPIDRRNKIESMDYGMDWLHQQRSVLLRVPSARVPFSSNILINPGHPEANAVTSTVHPFSFAA